MHKQCMPKQFYILIILAHFLFYAPANAGIYKCTSEDNNISFQESPCASGETSSELELKSAQVVRSEHPLPLPSVKKRGNSKTNSTDASTYKPFGDENCKSLKQQYKKESKRVVVACKKARETYCGQSAEQIEQTRDRKWMRSASNSQMRNFSRNNPSGSPLLALKAKMDMFNCR